jgi:hypothetical protein
MPMEMFQWLVTAREKMTVGMHSEQVINHLTDRRRFGVRVQQSVPYGIICYAAQLDRKRGPDPF